MDKTFRFAFAQMNPTVGDYSANVKKIMAWIRQAEKYKADLIVFPELALSGYPVWDLANKKGFVEEGLTHLHKIVKSTEGKRVEVALGFIDQDPKTGHSYNALAWIGQGKLKSSVYKRLLPTYDVFLEDIFFRRGKKSKIIPWNSFNVAPTICEDIWDENYSEKPLAIMAQQGASLAVNISASPYYQGVAQKRDALVRKQCVRYNLPMIYVNQVGAQDDLVFDGRSFFADEKGQVLFRCPRFVEDLFFFDWQLRRKAHEVNSSELWQSDPGEPYDALVLGIRDYCRKNGFKKALIGLSGGIDSALVAALACDALGSRAVLGITMPSAYSSKGSWEDSKKLAANLKMKCFVHPIRDKYDFLLKSYRAQAKKNGFKVAERGKVTLAMENLQARLRGLELMYLSNDQGRILLSTGNKSELAVGYCTLYGDMAGGLAVLGDVYKTDVYRLCRYRNQKKEIIPESILSKPPSAELRPDQVDQDSLPPYDVLDEILYLYIEKNMSKKEIVNHMRGKKTSQKIIADVIRKTDHNEYKRRQTPPILRITEKAWFGRRMPITNRFDR